MYCQFEQLKERNVVVRCFNQALYHVSTTEIHAHNYCALHIQKLPRKTKLELLFDVIELPPSEIPSLSCSHNQSNETDIIQSSAGLVTSNKISNALYHLASHERDMNTDISINNNMSCSENEPHASTLRISKVNFNRPFKNLGELCECYGYLPRPKTWRMLPFAVPGEIHALPNTRGMAVATNGIHVAIENSTYNELFIGHLDWFIVDDLRAPAGAIGMLNQAAESGFKVVRNQLKQFDELFV